MQKRKKCTKKFSSLNNSINLITRIFDQYILKILNFLFYFFLSLFNLLVLSACTGSAGGSLDSSSDALASQTPCGFETVNSTTCTIEKPGVVATDIIGNNITEWTNSNSSTTVSSKIPGGFYPQNSVSVIFNEPNLISAYIVSGKSIFNVTGNANSPMSNAHRDKVITQISVQAETTTYAGTSLPPGYRDVPDISKDDDGILSPVSSSSQTTLAVRPDYDCGTTQTTIADRIAHCLEVNSSKSFWNGAVDGNAGQALWKLVTRKGLNNEVWQDQRTGLLWSSLVTAAGDNWCRAAGNGQTTGNGYSSNDPDSICNNATYQPNYVNDTTPFIVQSWCIEDGPVSLQPADPSEVWGANPTYSNAKGGMGLTATSVSPSVRWRLPNKYDYQQADIDGIRFVLPDINSASNTFEWIATIYGNSGSRRYAWMFSHQHGNIVVDSGGLNSNRNTNRAIRCIGRGQ